ncbi:cbb3-type cytochrome oxidase assembly protein CcoS [Seleniivibrio woodruffii]|uniref:Cbb3-type cytochrome oxidase maturation protein n=1 Tax=Seleniivibrio woodruffii TaxID=1078050 RepID=A0A4R1K8J9_9BACT|nr:cbb3-type cytochrome oxidase assembly protein CcoS [Seleniivibrio woodruffii]TCK60676.1 cbb3-type cytochrome oxidase maturation protein [Seleniivibrio woodruffii]TVZ36306.1 cbb3-type cytochrome oxidase maturation protein [Seleniivibrio woodruffii]
MGALYIMIPVSLILGVIVLLIFLWAGKTGEFEDMEGPKYRMMDDDDDDK